MEEEGQDGTVNRKGSIETGFVLLDENAKLYYELYGESDDERPKVLLITGYGAKLHLWGKLVPRLTRDYHVCAFDNRGVGRSEAPVGKYTTTSMAADTLKLLDHLKWDKVHVVGASMGGMIAQELALLAPAVYKPMMSMMFTGDKAKEKMIEMMLEKGVSKRFLANVGTGGKSNRDRIKEEWTTHFDEWFEISVLSLASTASAAHTHYVSDDRLTILRDSGIVLTCHICTADELMPPDQQWHLQRILAADAVVFNGAGHMGSTEDFPRFVAAIRHHIERAVHPPTDDDDDEKKEMEEEGDGEDEGEKREVQCL